MNFDDEVQFMRIGFATGLLSVDDVATWADRCIEFQGQPSPELIDISAARSLGRSEIIDRLIVLRSMSDAHAAVIPFATLLSRKLRIESFSPKSAATLLSRLSDAIGHEALEKFDPEIANAAYQLEEDYFLAESMTYGSPDICDQNVRDFFRKYERFECELPKGV